jgi:hypothetical protein
MVQATPLLRGLDLLYEMVTAADYRGDGLAALWDSGGPKTQLARLYRLLCDVNGLLDVVISFVYPTYGEVPFFTAQVSHGPAGHRPETLLSP